jgi:cytochrome c oxidase subunit 2
MKKLFTFGLLLFFGLSLPCRILGADVKEVEMTAKKYEYSPSSVEVPVGTVIRFKITALDKEHGFEIEGVKDSCVHIKKGESATVEYKAEKAGTFEFKCCKFCGFGHGKMKGTIVVK